MLLVIVSCASAVIGLLIGGIVTAVINAAKGRTLTLPVKLLLSVVIGAVLVLGTGVAYFGSYYRAEDTAKEYLKGKGEVRVSETDNGWLFDGPGEETAVIFYPGGKVEASAYAPLMYKIADNGEDCFLVKMPLNMAFFGIDSADEIIDEYDYDSWYIAGHSLGGVSASGWASDNADKLDGIILLASYPPGKIDDKLDMLTIRGSEDGVINNEAYEESRSKFPSDTEELIIDGGNHGGFGSYGEQKGDGKASISPEEQQKQTADHIDDFIEHK